MYYNKRIWNIIKDIYTYKKTKVSLKLDFYRTTGTNIPKILSGLTDINIYRGNVTKDIKNFNQLYGLRMKFLNKNGPKN